MNNTQTSAITVAYQGIEGAYSHLACKTFFPEYTALACENFQTAIHLVEKGNADFAMIPLENSTAGRVEEIYRLLPKTHLHIIGEHFEPVNHCLLALPGIKLEQIKTVASHPQALAQCFHRLEDLNITPLVAIDTALSAKDLASKKESVSLYGSHGAIASTLAAELYGLNIISENKYQELSLRYGHLFEASIGADAVFHLLSRINLEKTVAQLTEEQQQVRLYGRRGDRLK